METIQALLTRRSVRHYTNEPVSAEQQETILKAAMHAPSANNQQPWQFVVVTKRDKLNRLSEIHPYAKSLLEAPHCVSSYAVIWTWQSRQTTGCRTAQPPLRT